MSLAPSPAGREAAAAVDPSDPILGQKLTGLGGLPVRAKAAIWQNRVGRLAEIRRNEDIVRRGIIEEEMPDGSGLWLAADVIDRREYFHKDLGFELWV